MLDPKKLKLAYDSAKKLVNLVEAIDQRAMACDGPVPPTHEEATDEESRLITEWIKRIGRQA